MKQLLYSSAWLTLTFGANIISAFTIDLLPRNKYVSIGLFSCLTCLVLEAALVATYVGATPVNAAGLKAATFSVFLFALAYGIFMDGAMFTYVGEIYPNHLRSRGVNLALATHALVNILYTTPAPTGFKYVHVDPSSIVAMTLTLDSKEYWLEVLSPIYLRIHSWSGCNLALLSRH